MKDLVYAPPPFVNDKGDQIVFVDFEYARYRIAFNALKQSALVLSEIQFRADTPGLPVVSMNQPIKTVLLDGESVEIIDQPSPDGEVPFKVLSLPVSPGLHQLAIESCLTKDGPYGPPITWFPDRQSLECVFDMSDIRFPEGGYLEAFLPSNFNFDHFRMSIAVSIADAQLSHSVFSNGSISRSPHGQWNIEFPSFYTSSCPWFHVGVSDYFRSIQDEFLSSDGREIPIFIYTKVVDNVTELLVNFLQKTKAIMRDLEADFGPFPHGSVTIYARDSYPNPMEYAGAAATTIDALRHELDHSYFARSIVPANGDAGWIDEALAKWGDRGYPRYHYPPANRANLGKRSPYSRITDGGAYTVGLEFVAHLDYILRDRGGLKPFLATYADKKRHQSVTAGEFQALVEDYYGGSLQQLFETYVYSR